MSENQTGHDITVADVRAFFARLADWALGLPENEARVCAALVAAWASPGDADTGGFGYFAEGYGTPKPPLLVGSIVALRQSLDQVDPNLRQLVDRYGTHFGIAMSSFTGDKQR